MLGISRLMSGGLITNYSCTSRCRHCLYACSPARSRDYIDTELTEDVLRKIASLGCSSLHIGGGEPLLAPDKLLPVLNAFRKLGVQVEYVETNSSWYKCAEQAEQLLDKLQAAGLTTLLISISPFHNEYIPLAKIKGVLAACRTTGMGIFPWVEGFYNDLAAFPDDRPQPLAAYQEKFGPDYLRDIPDRYWVTLRGRALTTYAPYLPALPWQTILEQSGGSCRELLDTSHFHIDLYGNYIPGLCSGLAIRYTDLGQSLAPASYPFIIALLQGGISALFTLVRSEYSFEPRPGYVSKCALCQDIRRFLVCEKQLDTPELQPVGFYGELG